MTLKVVHGKASPAHGSLLSETAVLQRADSAAEAAKSTSSSQQVQTEAVVTTLRFATRAGTAGERITSAEGARDVAKRVAQKVRGEQEREGEAHAGLGQCHSKEVSKPTLLS